LDRSEAEDDPPGMEHPSGKARQDIRDQSRPERQWGDVGIRKPAARAAKQPHPPMAGSSTKRRPEG